MGSDGALARVTYLPGVTPLDAQTHNAGSEPIESHGPLAGDRQAAERRAENVSMHALTRRGQSRWELRQVLISRELEPSVVEAELERLERVGLIDDAALAEVIVRTQHERKGLGRSALVAEMRRRRIDQDTIDTALEPLGIDDERQRAGELAERRARQLMGLDHNTAVRRLTGYLQRKGYSADTVRNAVLVALPRPSSGVRFR